MGPQPCLKHSLLKAHALAQTQLVCRISRLLADLHNHLGVGGDLVRCFDGLPHQLIRGKYLQANNIFDRTPV
jgi:hypothetical protein